MTSHTVYDYKIAAGNGQAGSLTNIESITPTGDKAFYPPAAYGGFNPAAFQIRGNGTVYQSGFGSTVWVFSKMTRAQYDYLRTTYCSGGYSGLVTVRTRTGATSYANFNAVIILPKPSDMQRKFTVWTDVQIQFTRMVAL